MRLHVRVPFITKMLPRSERSRSQIRYGGGATDVLNAWSSFSRLTEKLLQLGPGPALLDTFFEQADLKYARILRAF